MRNNSILHFPEFIIFYPVFFTGLLDDLTYGRVVNMGNLWKKMMLDLEIKSPNQPTDELIIGSEISCSSYLVNCPVVINFIGRLFRQREIGVFYSVCKLEYYAE